MSWHFAGNQRCWVRHNATVTLNSQVCRGEIEERVPTHHDGLLPSGCAQPAQLFHWEHPEGFDSQSVVTMQFAIYLQIKMIMQNDRLCWPTKQRDFASKLEAINEQLGLRRIWGDRMLRTRADSATGLHHANTSIICKQRPDSITSWQPVDVRSSPLALIVSEWFSAQCAFTDIHPGLEQAPRLAFASMLLRRWTKRPWLCGFCWIIH